MLFQFQSYIISEIRGKKQQILTVDEQGAESLACCLVDLINSQNSLSNVSIKENIHGGVDIWALNLSVTDEHVVIFNIKMWFHIQSQCLDLGPFSERAEASHRDLQSPLQPRATLLSACLIVAHKKLPGAQKELCILHWR